MNNKRAKIIAMVLMMILAPLSVNRADELSVPYSVSLTSGMEVDVLQEANIGTIVVETGKNFSNNEISLCTWHSGSLNYNCTAKGILYKESGQAGLYCFKGGTPASVAITGSSCWIYGGDNCCSIKFPGLENTRGFFAYTRSTSKRTGYTQCYAVTTFINTNQFTSSELSVLDSWIDSGQKTGTVTINVSY